MNRRVFVALAISLFLALGSAPAFSQAATNSSGLASVSLSHSYMITSLGFGVLNDTFTFTNSGSSSVQIPTLHLGLPSKIASRVSDLVLSPSGQFSLSQSQSNGTTLLAIAPSQPTLAADANTTVAVKAVLTNIFNFTSPFGTKAPLLVLLSPSLDVNLTQMTSSIVLPTGGYLAQTPGGFSASAKNATTPTFTLTQTNVLPKISAGYLNFTESSQTGFTPIKVNSIVRTIVPTANGSPIVEETFSLFDLANYDIASVQLHLLDPSLQAVEVVPNTLPPLLNTQKVTLGSGVLTFASTTLGSPLIGQSNVTLEISYQLPSTMMAVAGNSVKLTIPYAPVISAPVSSYTIALATAKGVTANGVTSFTNETFNPFNAGNVEFTYTVSVGWAADQAIPAAALLFAVVFAMFAIQRPSAKEKGREEEKESLETADVLKAFEDKTGLETQYMEELSSATKGSISRTEFDRMRNEVADLRGRAIQRFNELRRDLGSGKQFDLLTRVGDAEKEEDRAFRDLLNLYLQYHGNRMNDETFKRLQPGYKKRVDSAINHLSDLLHEVQEEER